jgi:hypothetical protein
MAEAIELYKADGTTAGIFYCSECRIVYASKEQADCCHGEHLCACGKKVTKGHFQHMCEECARKDWHDKEEAKEAERFEKATKIKASDYAGDHVMCGDKFYDSVEDAVDQFLEGQEPDYVWACQDSHLPKVDLEDVTCNLLDNMWDDADTSDLNGIEELETALGAFNKANESISLWELDYSTAILVEKRKESDESV